MFESIAFSFCRKGPLKTSSPCTQSKKFQIHIQETKNKSGIQQSTCIALSKHAKRFWIKLRKLFSQRWHLLCADLSKRSFIPDWVAYMTPVMVPFTCCNLKILLQWNTVGMYCIEYTHDQTWQRVSWRGSVPSDLYYNAPIRNRICGIVERKYKRQYKSKQLKALILLPCVLSAVVAGTTF